MPRISKLTLPLHEITMPGEMSDPNLSESTRELAERISNAMDRNSGAAVIDTASAGAEQPSANRAAGSSSSSPPPGPPPTAPPRTTLTNAYRETWVARIKRRDPEFLTLGKNDIYLYLMCKLSYILKTKKSIGQAGWAWSGCPVAAIRCGRMWACGGKEQEHPLGFEDDEGQWWPIIFLQIATGPDGRCPTYCPGLAWQNARPWFAHLSRITPVETPGIIIEELRCNESLSEVVNKLSA